MVEGYNEHQLATLLMHVGRAAYAAEPRDELSPAQWMCLRYFSQANRFSRTVSGFADFHATTKGTASLTVTGLVERGLLLRHPSERDGRSQRIDLTDKAQQLLDDAVNPLVEALEVYKEPTANTVATVDRLILALAKAHGSATFGTCGRCTYLSAEPTAEDESRCTLLNEPLEEDDLERTCMNFEAADA